MIALDTNVLVRFLVEDDPLQTEQARVLLQQGIAEGATFYVPDIVLCEIVWVLSTSYRVPRQEIVDHLRRLLHASHLTFSSSERLARVLDAYASGKGDFADYLIREEARGAGYDAVATFDKALHGEPGFKEVPPRPVATGDQEVAP